MKFKSIIKQALNDDRGTSAVELALICGLILIGLIAAIKGLGGETNNTWTGVFDKASTAIEAS